MDQECVLQQVHMAINQLSVASWLAWWGLKGIGVYTGLCRLIKSWFDLDSGLFNQKRGSSARILVPEDNARPSCFPDGPNLGKSVRFHSCLRLSLSPSPVCPGSVLVRTRLFSPDPWVSVLVGGGALTCPRLACCIVTFCPLPRSHPGSPLPRLSKYLSPAPSPWLRNTYLLWLIKHRWLPSRLNVVPGVTKKNVRELTNAPDRS